MAAAGQAQLTDPGASAAALMQALPDFLGARALRSVVDAAVAAVAADRPVVCAMGAHVIKVGCAPVLVDLMRRGVVTAIAGNGAVAIHDVEVAMLGETSEEVAETIRDGTFGMVQETMTFFNEAAERAQSDRAGLGAAVGRLLIERDAPGKEESLFAVAAELGIPACVHVALGTDTVHMSGGLSGEALGAASMLDFRLICDVVCDLGCGPRKDGARADGKKQGDAGVADGAAAGGVWLNVGSAVIMPEVFLKAVSVARNLGADLDAMTTANFDMIRHYRPGVNVVSRPVRPGRGFEVVGHHEIMLPLLRQAIIDRMAADGITRP